MYKDNDKSKKENSSTLYQTYQISFKKINLMSGPLHKRQVVHPRPQTPQGESVDKPETLLLIILGLVLSWV